MVKGARGLFNRAAFDREDHVAFGLAANLDDARPVHDAIAARAADGRAGHLAALGAALLDGNVLRVKVHEMAQNACQPLQRVLAAEIGVAGIEMGVNGAGINGIDARKMQRPKRDAAQSGNNRCRKKIRNGSRAISCHETYRPGFPEIVAASGGFMMGSKCPAIVMPPQ